MSATLGIERLMAKTTGAPETDPKRIRGILTRVTQTIDTWSFGCVLSIAATWVILGYQGILQYETLRRQAVSELRKRHDQDPAVGTPTAHDAFHNGCDVLPEVLHWHNYLRTIARHLDCLSVGVLGLIEKRMLLWNPGDRISSTHLCEELNFMLKAADTDYTNSHQDAGTHESVLKALLDYDQEAPASTTEAARAKSSGMQRVASTSSSSRHWMRGPDGASSAAHVRAPRKSRRIGKSEKLDNIPRGKTAHRAEDLERELKSQPAIPETSSMSGFSDSPTEEVGESMAQSLIKPAIPIPLVTVDGQFTNTTPSRMRRNGRSPNVQEISDSHETASGPYQTPNPQQQRQQTPPSTMPSQGYGAAVRPMGPQGPPESSTPSPPELPSRPVTVRLSVLDPALDVYRVRVELERKRSGRFGRTKKDSYLKNFVTDRDMVRDCISRRFACILIDLQQKFIVDNGTTMRPFWKVATFVLETLTMKLAGLDDDGLDLVFTIGTDWNISNAGKTAVAKFAKAM